jgi:hypothetical protein
MARKQASHSSINRNIHPKLSAIYLPSRSRIDKAVGIIIISINGKTSIKFYSNYYTTSVTACNRSRVSQLHMPAIVNYKNI